MDKVQKIYEEVVRLQNELIQEKEKGYGSDVDDACILELQNVLTYIDSLQKEPVSIWHDAIEKPNIKEKGGIFVVTLLNGEYIGSRYYNYDDITINFGHYDKWAYLNDLINLSNVERTVKDWKEEPKFNVGDTICNKELTVFIYNISGGKYWVKDVSDSFDFGYLEISNQDEWELVEKPVSGDLEEAANRYAKEEYSRKNPATLPKVLEVLFGKKKYVNSMVLDKEEYFIQDDGIWISKKALEECKQHYYKVADKFSPKPKKQDLDFRYPFYLGKADICVDLLKHFEPLEP